MNAWLEALGNLQRQRPPPVDSVHADDEKLEPLPVKKKVRTVIHNDYKSCTGCGKLKHTGEFYFQKERRRPEGRYSSQCKKCLCKTKSQRQKPTINRTGELHV